MVRFSKKGNLYKVFRIIGNQDNILGICFADKNHSENTIEVIEWSFPNIDSSLIRTSKEKVLTQLLSGLNWVNQALETNYPLSKLYYVPSENGSDRIYESLIRKLIRHYQSGNEVREIVSGLSTLKFDCL